MNRIIPLMFVPLFAFAAEPPQTLEILPQDILSTKVTTDGRRRIIIQKLDPQAMAEKERELRPAPVAPPVPAPAFEPLQPDDGKPVRQLSLGASVHIPDPTRPENAFTFLQLWPTGGGKPIASLWVNANFLWLTGLSQEIETATARYNLLLIASHGGQPVPENLPFPADSKATLVIAEGDPTEEQLEPIDRLLARYDAEKVRLRENFERQQREAAEAEAERRANPQEKKDLIIRYWRTDPSARSGNKPSTRPPRKTATISPDPTIPSPPRAPYGLRPMMAPPL